MAMSSFATYLIGFLILIVALGCFAVSGLLRREVRRFARYSILGVACAAVGARRVRRGRGEPPPRLGASSGNYLAD
jgi:hypothetical protein